MRIFEEKCILDQSHENMEDKKISIWRKNIKQGLKLLEEVDLVHRKNQ